MSFNEDDIPNLAGNTALVTGATGGLGFEMARMLAGAGARVIVAGRNAKKGADALARIRAISPKADIIFEQVDLGSLGSITDFGARMRATGNPIDILINNAGVMTPPRRKITSDGFELQFGTNHLGHFALTGQLLPLLATAKAPRVVSISSGAANFGRIDFGNLQAEQHYRPTPAYNQSKLANLLFARHLQRMSDRNGWNLVSVAAHPGFAPRTDLISNGPGELRGLKRVLHALLHTFASHDATGGAMPAILAATGRDVQKLDYFGPSKMKEFKGPPGPARLPVRAKDDQVAQRLWEVSEKLTGITYVVEKASA
jgi:NAD(P)-dependent dehydrogenase (short-subunit alcohol dehydrogenase family)